MTGNTIIAFNIVLIIINLLFLISIIVLLIKLLYKRINIKSIQYSIFNENAEKGRCVFAGDSLTEFYPLHEYFPNKPIYNRGIAGDTTKGLLNRLNTNIINLSPKKVFLQIGTNDFFRCYSIVYIYKNIISIITKIKTALPNILIYLISLYPVNSKEKWYYKLGTYPRRNKKIDKLNAMLYEYATNNNLTYIDINSKLKDNEGRLSAEYTIDGLHISANGYKVISEIIEKYINL